MKPAPSRAGLRRRNGARGPYRIRLYLVGDGPNSNLALANLRRLCEEHLKDRHRIETIDVLKNPDAAARDNILITPALILVAPLPRVTILGNLSDLPKVLHALRLTECAP